MGPVFLVDINVARLAGWLRAMGCDTARSPGLDERSLLRWAREESRTLLTRNARLMERRAVAQGEVRALLLDSDLLWDQLRQVVRECGLDTHGTFSRCIRCNTILESVAKERVRDRVPPHVHRTQEAFMRCPSCDRVYWRGSHWRNMRTELSRVTEAAR